MKRYFLHNSNARNSDKLMQLRKQYGAEGYGVYLMIVERLNQVSNHLGTRDYDVIGYDLHIEATLIKSVVEDFGLFVFTDDGRYFYLDDQ